MSAIEPEKKSSVWDSDAMFAKAERYVESMLEVERDDFRFALWSALALEMLARAALAKIHPTLLADAQRWHNLYHALGHEPKIKKFQPKSIAIADVFKRLGEILPDFITELENFCTLHVGRRNAELHSGDMPFEGVDSSEWLPDFYRSCKVLLASLGKSLADFAGDDEAKLAEKLIASAADETSMAVAGVVKAHQTVWQGKADDEQKNLAQQAMLWASRQGGHRVKCPACNSAALVFGEPISAPKESWGDGLIVQSQQFLPNKFECIACGMKISGHSHLNVIGLGAVFAKASTFTPAEFYGSDEDESSHMYEEDNNEPY